MDDVFERFTFSVMRLNKLIQKIKTAEMEPYGLKAIHALCLYYLYKDRSLTAGDLAGLALEDKGALSRALKELKEKGYVCYHGGYQEKILLTAEGERLARAVAERAQEVAAAGSAALNEQERADFYKTLSSVADNLTDYYNRRNHD